MFGQTVQKMPDGVAAMLDVVGELQKTQLKMHADLYGRHGLIMMTVENVGHLMRAMSQMQSNRSNVDAERWHTVFLRAFDRLQSAGGDVQEVARLSRTVADVAYPPPPSVPTPPPEQKVDLEFECKSQDGDALCTIEVRVRDSVMKIEAPMLRKILLDALTALEPKP